MLRSSLPTIILSVIAFISRSKPTTSGFINDLQMKLAFQEDLLEQLNQVVTNQQQQITNLELALETMKVQVNTMQTGTQEAGQQHELPPHY